MTPSLHVATTDDLAPLGALLAHAFGFPPEDAAAWFERAGSENVLAYREEAGVAGGLLLVPMGQFFGGRSVPMMGVAGVGIAPERRGSGAGLGMMREAVREMRRRGAALSTLFPSTVPFYQRVGFERAGARFRFEVPGRELAGLAARGPSAEVRVEPRAVDPDAELESFQRAFAARHQGALDRGPYVWKRMTRPWRMETQGFAVRRGDALVGHVVLAHRQVDGHDTEVLVNDASALDIGAARGILAFLGGYRSIAERVVAQLMVPSVFQAALPDRRVDTGLPDFWMTRVLDVEKALASRGWGRALRGEVGLEVEDDVLPEATGRFLLRVEEGRATVTRGGDGALRVGARGLAAMFTGFLAASELCRMDLAAGRGDAVEIADALFAGPLPTMNEMF